MSYWVCVCVYLFVYVCVYVGVCGSSEDDCIHYTLYLKPAKWPYNGYILSFQCHSLCNGFPASFFELLFLGRFIVEIVCFYIFFCICVLLNQRHFPVFVL